MKKISWIVALLVALSFTILFSSCGEDYIDAFIPGSEVDGFAINTSNNKQGGWKIEGALYDELAAGKGIQITFGKAPAGGLQLVWQGWGEETAGQYGGWHQTNILDDSGGKGQNGASLSDKTVTIDIRQAFADYSTFVTSTAADKKSASIVTIFFT